MFEVERGIPIPPVASGRKIGQKNKYPWADMEVGDCFFVPNPPYGRNPVYSAASDRNRITRTKFWLRTESAGVRVWRVE